MSRRCNLREGDLHARAILPSPPLPPSPNLCLFCHILLERVLVGCQPPEEENGVEDGGKADDYLSVFRDKAANIMVREPTIRMRGSSSGDGGKIRGIIPKLKLMDSLTTND